MSGIVALMKTIQKKYRVDRKKIGFVKFIFEAHDGVAVVSTIDAKKNLIMLSIAPDLMEESDMIVNDLKKDFLFEEVQADEAQSVEAQWGEAQFVEAQRDEV